MLDSWRGILQHMAQLKKLSFSDTGHSLFSFYITFIFSPVQLQEPLHLPEHKSRANNHAVEKVLVIFKHLWKFYIEFSNQLLPHES